MRRSRLSGGSLAGLRWNMWTNEFFDRMDAFGHAAPHKAGETAVSIKIRVASGCFHREHSPNAYALIDAAGRTLGGSRRRFRFVEHESGPEILIYVAAATAGISLAKSLIDLVVTILKARSEGIKRGDNPSYPLELIVRRSVDRERVNDECVLRLEHSDHVDASKVEKRLVAAIRKLVGPERVQLDEPANKALQPASRAKRSGKPKRGRRAARG